MKVRGENALQAHLCVKKGTIMKAQNAFEKKDWMKEAKAFAKQVYGKKKMESIQQERRIMESIKQDEWWDD